ncbi:MAG: MATE family efflux transporter [Anaerococcus hydrogenalis]|uniref:MATE family efflux transporter n=1 Tax=Anaerococcus hydrogenalis TaxID=33029 RepID=UPI00290688C2|nr:MATE family efflux transporter [Anaerococcus hydrogenalis]MDU3688512.1 MATE family efflux transporter [Anaerococcus hydrogenalis]
MIKNRYWKRALQIAWPSVLESFFIALAGLIDTFMVSSIGPNAVAAIGLTTQPKFIALSFFIAISVSVSALVARRKGEQDKKMANQTMVTAMIVALLLCLIISSVFVIFTPQILKLSGSSPDTHDLGVSYFRIIMGGLIFNVISMTINAGQRGSGNTQIAFTTNLVSSLVNILFNYLLINGNLGFPKLGVAGAGLATVMGAIVAAIMSFSSLFRRSSYMSFKLIKKYALGFSNFIFKEILALGSNIFIENIAARIGFLVTAITAAKLGTDQFAAHNVGMNLLSLSFSFGDGMQVATVALTGNALGARKKDEAIKYGKTCQEIGLSISIIISIILVLFRKNIFRMFFDDEKIIAMGSIITFYLIFIVIFQISQIIFGGALRAAGDVKYTLAVSLISITFIRSAATLFFVNVLHLGIQGIWMGIMADQISRFVGLWTRFRKGDWVNIEI